MPQHTLRPWLRAGIVALLVCVSSACGPSTLQTLPPQQAAAYSRCSTYVERHHCSKALCGQQALSAYSRQPSVRREAWLERNGCPTRIARADSH